MELTGNPSSNEARGTAYQLGIMPIVGILTLIWCASVYSAYGLSAFPRQEWLIELLASMIFLIPVVNLLRGVSTKTHALRMIGMMLVLHSIWDAFHLPLSPGGPWIDTPIDPWIPKYCPYFDIPIGIWLWVRGR